MRRLIPSDFTLNDVDFAGFLGLAAVSFFYEQVSAGLAFVLIGLVVYAHDRLKKTS